MIHLDYYQYETNDNLKSWNTSGKLKAYTKQD